MGVCALHRYPIPLQFAEGSIDMRFVQASHSMHPFFDEFNIICRFAPLTDIAYHINSQKDPLTCDSYRHRTVCILSLFVVNGSSQLQILCSCVSGFMFSQRCLALCTRAQCRDG